MREILTGLRAFLIYTSVSSEYSTISIFSPRSSCTIDWTRIPLIPTQAPTASTSRSLVLTAILVLPLGSRTLPIISIIPSLISGTSISNRFLMSPVCVRERITVVLRAVLPISRTYARIRSPRLNDSRNTCSRLGRIPSAFPKSTMISPC